MERSLQRLGRIMAALLALSGASCTCEGALDLVKVKGQLLDPEFFYNARHGVLTRFPIGPDTGPCWSEPCPWEQAEELATVNGTIGSVEDPFQASGTSEDGSFEVFAVAGGAVHLIGKPSSGHTHRDTINAPAIVPGANGLDGVVLYILGEYDMMTFVEDFWPRGVAVVSILDGRDVLTSMPLTDPEGLRVEVTGGRLLWWVFDFANPDRPGGWTAPVEDLADAPPGFTWTGMIAIVDPEELAVTVEVTDEGSGGGRPFEYRKLEVPMRRNNFSYGRMTPIE